MGIAQRKNLRRTRRTQWIAKTKQQQLAVQKNRSILNGVPSDLSTNKWRCFPQ